MDHDRLHKLLLETFFEPFLAAFVPRLAAELTPMSLVSVSQEVLAETLGQGDRRADLVMRGRVRGRNAFLLVHVEVQSRPDPALRERMYRYHQRLEVKHGLDVHPVVVLGLGWPRKAHAGEYVRESGGLEVVRFRYDVVQLSRLRWESYAGLDNPVAVALLPHMAVSREDRERVKWESWRQLVKLARGLSGRAREVLTGFLTAYAPLSSEAQLRLVTETKKEFGLTQEAFDDLSWLPKAFPAVTQEALEAYMIRQWREEGLAQGLEQGLEQGRHEAALRLCLRVLAVKLGPLSPSIVALVEAQPVGRLEDLVEATFGLSDEAALRGWLQG
jgi:hypothetical protein